MPRNGKQQPARPSIEIRQSSASSEEAAAIAAAIEQFLRDTAPPPTRPEETSRWLRRGLLEGAKVHAAGASSSGDPDPWGRDA